ncbi:hypothetical protein BU23DRAFT_122245 [Bimuria novae-zelandiae CBS 107.79]|uniref:Uncharacterized protein n=1 Tax=Bimuria novae-zelandiae CBS 107.79 TaxID=1447943 RepID=A0A6A5VKU6_9PLEO|nr:hypothetical protein BU23DRAFT_122245 [Bimuria novae-zelandiae CBS 107.79]
MPTGTEEERVERYVNYSNSMLETECQRQGLQVITHLAQLLINNDEAEKGRQDRAIRIPAYISKFPPAANRNLEKTPFQHYQEFRPEALLAEVNARKLKCHVRKEDRTGALAKDDNKNERNPQRVAPTSEAPVITPFLTQDSADLLAKQNPNNNPGRVLAGIWIPASKKDGSGNLKQWECKKQPELLAEMQARNLPDGIFKTKIERAAAIVADDMGLFKSTFIDPAKEKVKLSAVPTPQNTVPQDRIPGRGHLIPGPPSKYGLHGPPASSGTSHWNPSMMARARALDQPQPSKSSRCPQQPSLMDGSDAIVGSQHVVEFAQLARFMPDIQAQHKIPTQPSHYSTMIRHLASKVRLLAHRLRRHHSTSLTNRYR